MNWYRNLAIGTKLLSAFVLVALITGAVGWMGIRNMGDLNDVADEMYARELMGVSYIKEANINLVYIQRATRGMLLASDEETRQKFATRAKESIARLEENLEKARPLFWSEEGKQLLAQFDQAWAGFKQVNQRVLAMAQQDALQSERASVALAMGEALEKGDVVDTLMTRLARVKAQNAQQFADQTTVLYQKSRLFMILLALAAVAIGVGLGFLISHLIARPIRRVQWLLGEIGQGRLSARVSDVDQKDEVGELVRLANGFAAELGAQVLGVLDGMSRGDFSAEVKARDERDEIAPVMIRIRSVVKGLVDETAELTRAAKAGELSTRADAEKFEGAYRELVGRGERDAGCRHRAGERGGGGAGRGRPQGPHGARGGGSTGATTRRSRTR